MIPFSQEVLLALFEEYNVAVWPALVVAYLLGSVVVIAALRPIPFSGRVTCLVLALFWLWDGVVFHWVYFTPINVAAPLFAGMFALQGVLFAVATRRSPEFRFRHSISGWTGVGLMLIAMIAYPLVSLLAGQPWPATPAFAVTPSSTTLFTFGALMLSQPRAPLWLYAIPLAWALIGGTAAWHLEMPQDFLLPVAGLLATAFRLIPVVRSQAETA